MDVDDEGAALQRIAAGGSVQEGAWPRLCADLLARLDKNVREAFPIPKLPPPRAAQPRPASAIASSPLLHSSPRRSVGPVQRDTAPAPDTSPAQSSESAAPAETSDLPKQIVDMVDAIKKQLSAFATHAPHTVQRLVELMLEPRAHYQALASYLHAVDRVVHVTSATTTYPLPPAVPDLSAFRINGQDSSDALDAAEAVAWSNSTTAALGSDEALGGALLTPIPWLTRSSPDSSTPDPPGAQIHSEGTETIDGPNGVGSIETVSVSVNGVPSTGHARGITQGELLRQEQRAGVVPVSQLSRNHDAIPASGADDDAMDTDAEADVDEGPHARGPNEIGVNDMGPQGPTTSYVGGDGGIEMQGIDVAAAVGRDHHEDTVYRAQVQARSQAKAQDEAEEMAARKDEEDAEMRDARGEDDAEKVSLGTKREGDKGLQGTPPKKMREGDEMEKTDAHGEAAETRAEEEGEQKV